MDLKFVPRADMRSMMAKGYHTIPGYTSPLRWAVLMQFTGKPEHVPAPKPDTRPTRNRQRSNLGRRWKSQARLAREEALL